MQTTPFRRSCQMSGSIMFRQAKLCGLLQKEGCTEVRALRDIKPTQGVRHIHKVVINRRSQRDRDTKIPHILLDEVETPPRTETREDHRNFTMKEQRVDSAMKPVLYLQEPTVTLKIGERLAVHDLPVEPVMYLARSNLQSLRSCQRR